MTAQVGPSGCGKTTFLNCLTRMIEPIDGARFRGDALLDGASVYAPDLDVVDERRCFGVVAQRPNPFPGSVRRNVLYGGAIRELYSDHETAERILEAALRRADLWDEVKDQRDVSGLALSGGQQQRLCIARAIAAEPEVLPMDEPTSAIDPVATARVEDPIRDLARDVAVVIVTHNMEQARRVMALVEAVANVVAGCGLAVAAQIAVFARFGIEVALGEHLANGLLFVGDSLARG